jgi:hypothetical protein
MNIPITFQNITSIAAFLWAGINHFRTGRLAEKIKADALLAEAKLDAAAVLAVAKLKDDVSKSREVRFTSQK